MLTENWRVIDRQSKAIEREADRHKLKVVTFGAVKGKDRRCPWCGKVNCPNPGQCV